MSRIHLIAGAAFGLGIVSLAGFAEPPMPNGDRLREIAARSFSNDNVHVGAAAGWNELSGDTGVILAREFSYVTPENDFKQHDVHPSPGRWDWEDAAAWIEWCRNRRQIMRIHGPISPQCSNWAQDDARTTAELRQNMKEYFTALCEYINPHEHIVWMDVVNETVTRKGEWFGPKPGTDKWENPWLILGFDESSPLRPPLYIKEAFEIANKHAPDKKLVLNQHGGMEEEMWTRVTALIPYLRGQGLRVDGLGWQAHVDVGWEKEGANLERLGLLIDWAHRNGLEFHITENNVWLKDDVKDYDAQAETFAAILRKLLEHRHTGVVTWNVWDVGDADLWSETYDYEGCLFDRQYRPKPAYYAIQKVLEEAGADSSLSNPRK